MGKSQWARRLSAVALVMVLFAAAPAGADIVIEFDDLIFGDVGSVRTVAEADVPADLVGRTCEISVLAENQASVHIGNDVIVLTGSSEAVIVGVEDEANGGTNEIYNVVMGPTILVHLRFGQDGMSSLGFSLTFDCDKPITTTTASTSVPTIDGGDLNGGASTTTVAVGNSTDGTTSTGCSTGGGGSGTGSTATTVTTDSTAAGSVSTTGSAGSLVSNCPDTGSSTDGGATSTSTPAGGSTTESGTDAGDGSSTALPAAPVATAVVAAPAYAG